MLAAVAAVHLGLAISTAAAQASVFYMSPTGDDSATGDSPATAWRTLDRAQRALASGASNVELLLERGGVFPGALTLRNVSSIRIAAWGEGPRPVITGLAALPRQAWQPVPDLPGQWRATCSVCPAGQPLTLLVRRGRGPQPIARWPNRDEASDGYRTYQAAAGRLSITDNTLPDGIDWTGADVVLRSAAWILDRLPVIRQQGKTLSFATAATYEIPRGYGYFLQNHAAALDQPGEWTFDAATRTLTVLTGEPDPPEDGEYSVPVRDVLLSASGGAVTGLDISDIRFEGARRAAIELLQVRAGTVADVEAVLSADSGIRCIDCAGFRLTASTIAHALNHGLDVYNCAQCLVEENRIEDIATIAGLGRSGNGQYNGVRFGGAGSVFARNVVNRTGYLGVDIRGPAVIEDNVVTRFNLVKTDGGGIYTWTNRDVRITGNLVREGRGSLAGVPWNSPATHGIYIDDQSEDVEVRGNTVIDVGSYGVYLHNTRQVRVEDNQVIAAAQAGIGLIDDDLGSYTVTGTSVRGNIFTATSPGAVMARASTNQTSADAFFRSIGVWENNLYCSPLSEAPIFQTSIPTRPRVFLGQWQQLLQSDSDARTCGIRLPSVTVQETTGPDRVQNGRFDNGIQGWFGWPSESLRASWVDGGLQVRHEGVPAPLIHYDTPAGLIEAGRFYRLRFEVRTAAAGGAEDRLFRVYLRKWDPDYRHLAPALDLPMGSAARSYDLVFRATENEPRSLLIFEVPQSSESIWLDNVRLEPVQASDAAPASRILLEWNDSAEVRRVRLDAAAQAADGTVYEEGAEILLQPRQAILLFRLP